MNSPVGYLKDCLPDGKTEAEYRASRPLSMVQVIRNMAVQRGMSDDQLANEREAYALLDHAIDVMRAAIGTVNHCSTLVQIDPTTFDNFVHDELSFDWDGKIAHARQA